MKKQHDDITSFELTEATFGFLMEEHKLINKRIMELIIRDLSWWVKIKKVFPYLFVSVVLLNDFRPVKNDNRIPASNPCFELLAVEKDMGSLKKETNNLHYKIQQMILAKENGK